MDSNDTPRRSTSRRTRMAVVLGAAALALPGGALIGNAVASDGAPGSSTAIEQQAPGTGFAPVQESQPDRERPDVRDCPKEDGNGGGSGSATPESQTTPEQTAF